MQNCRDGQKFQKDQAPVEGPKPEQGGHSLSLIHIYLSSGLSEEELELLKMTPAAFLGSCRFKLPEALSSEFYPTLFNKFEELNIGYFFYIGGNDSMDTVSKLSRYANGIGSDIRFIGIPKTIDNDLVGTDHTPGFGSAAKYVASTVREICLLYTSRCV